jgi:hypothetical protein
MKAPINVIPTTLAHLVYLCRNMRADEAEQLRAFYVEADCEPDILAARLYAQPGPRFTTMIDGLPAVAGGFTLTNGTVWQSWMVGTQIGWDRGWRSITKATRWLASEMFRTGATKLETCAIASRCPAHGWYARALHMTPEGVRRQYGLRGEDIHWFGVTSEEF